MTFASLPWLFALVPWGILLVYLLVGRSPAVPVPFLDLWPPAESKSNWKQPFRPPLAVFAGLTAILLAILAAAHPEMHQENAGADRPVTLIIDHGITMSARNQPAPDLQQILGPCTVNIRFIPSPGPSAVDTKSLVADEASHALVDPQSIVIVQSDQKLGLANPRLIQIVPPAKLQNIGIADLTVRASPTPQAMVRVTNDSDETQATLTVTGASPQTINLPPRGQQANFFVDLPSAPPIVEASIIPNGGISLDDHAWSVRGSAWPAVEARAPLFPELDRMLNVYRRNRPTDGHRIVAVCKWNQLPPDAPAVATITPSDASFPLTNSNLKIEPGPITNGVDFSAIASDAILAPSPANWHPIITAGRQILLAARDNPRQVWIGFRSPAFSATPDFVIFWTKVLDWLGAGDDRYSSARVSLKNGLLPGLYTQDGKTVAVNADPIRLDPATPTDWQTQLKQLAAEYPAHGIDLARPLILAAFGFVLLAVVLWPR